MISDRHGDNLRVCCDVGDLGGRVLTLLFFMVLCRSREQLGLRPAGDAARAAPSAWCWLPPSWLVVAGREPVSSDTFRASPPFVGSGAIKSVS